MSASDSQPFTFRMWKRVAAAQALVTLVAGSGIYVLWLVVGGELETGRFTTHLAFARWSVALYIVQSLFLAFTHDYHDRLTQEMSRVVRVPPEDVVEGEPSPRLDTGWVRRKVRRRIRGVMVTIASVVLLSTFFSPLTFLLDTHLFSTAVLAVVTGYWWLVFTAARSARAWRGEGDPTPPAPLRAFARAVRDEPWLNWWGPKQLIRLATWGTKSMFPPARAIEADVPVFIGLGLARILCNVPVLKLLLRSAFIVAVGDVLLQLQSNEGRVRAAEAVIEVAPSVDRAG